MTLLNNTEITKTDKKNIKFNAIGQQINVGDFVGWTSNKRGFSYIFMGTVKGFSEKQVAIDVKVKKCCLYENEFEDEEIPPRAVSVRSYMLFPVDEKELNYAKVTD